MSEGQGQDDKRRGFDSDDAINAMFSVLLTVIDIEIKKGRITAEELIGELQKVRDLIQRRDPGMAAALDHWVQVLGWLHLMKQDGPILR